MEKIFVNHTQHELTKEQLRQLEAEGFTTVMDVLSPANVDPYAPTDEVRRLAHENAQKILSLQPTRVMAMGELSYSHNLLKELEANKVEVVVATSNRISKEVQLPDGTVRKVNEFKHVQFREI